MVATYRARHRLRITPDHWREPGELVPEAITWFRLLDSLHCGKIVAAEVGEEEFRAAIARYCPELEDRIATLTGLNGDMLVGSHATPRLNVRPGTFTAQQREWALSLDPGPLLGPVPKARTQVPPRAAVAQPKAAIKAPARKAPAKRAPAKKAAAKPVIEPA